jgi:hypothetical protein
MKELNSKSIVNEDEFSKEIEKKFLKVKKKVKKRVEKVKETPLKKKEKPRVIKKKPLKIKHSIKTNTTPIISIEGENPLFLNVGETFEEPGVTAEDKEDGEVVVTSSENIDKYKEGKYAVIYMAIDSEGNSAVDKRYVIIGDENANNEDNVEEKPREESLDESNKSKSKDEESDAQYRLEERELEIAEWERELQFREKEISQREKSISK